MEHPVTNGILSTKLIGRLGYVQVATHHSSYVVSRAGSGSIIKNNLDPC